MKKLTEAERLEIARRLAVMDRQMLVGVRELAVIYNTTVASIQQACSSTRVARGDVALRLPQRVAGLGRRVAWVYGDVRDCLAQVSSAAGILPSQSTESALAQKSLAGSSADKAGERASRMGRKRKA